MILLLVSVFTDSSDFDDDGEDETPFVADDLWMRIFGEDVAPDSFPFLAAAGPVHAPPPDSEPIEYAKLFITDELVDILVMESNRYGDQWIAKNQKYLQAYPKSMVRESINQGSFSKEEMYAFISVILNMRLLNKPTIESYWDSVNPSQATPWFNMRLSKDRFFLIMMFLHFANNDDAPGEDHADFKLYKINPLIKFFNKKFKRYFIPHKDISIDESMVGFKGKTPHLRQYIPNKHHTRFGVKLRCLSDSASGYTVGFEVYKGAHEDEKQAEEATHTLVMRLMAACRLLHLGYHLGLNNFFTSPRLLFDLFESQTSATGTVRRNRKGLPPSVIKAKLQNKQVCERRKRMMLCVAYKDGSKQPMLLSTHSSAGFQRIINSRGKEKTLPMCVIHYNRAMGRVDLSDARLYRYLSERRTMKWTNKVAFSLIGRSLLNAYIIYSENTSDRPKKSKYQFTVSVIENMVPQKTIKTEIAETCAAPPFQINPNPACPAVPGPSPCTLVKLPVGKRRDCAYKQKHTKRVRSSYQCATCDVGLCPQCFSPYHLPKKVFTKQ